MVNVEIDVLNAWQSNRNPALWTLPPEDAEELLRIGA
jgi:hypothetical protein